jgi:HD-GYP domain-containing protein (c-di-GMP phosphodiesterase class II)
MHCNGISAAIYLVESAAALDALLVMAQKEKKALQDVNAITTTLPVADGSCLTVANPAAQPTKSGVSKKQFSHSIATLGRGDERSEIGRAIDLLNNMAAAVAKIHRAVRRGKPLELQSVQQDIDALIDNFADGSNALFWSLAANRQMYYLSRRSVGCAVWALALGQRLDFDRIALHELMLGALLLDIGKLSVPVVILAKGSKLNKSEQNFTRRHVTDSVRTLEAVDGLSPAIIEMVHSHHERIDGSGYPFGLKGGEISLHAQIAGIVDSYDALSLNRYYADGLSGHAAISTLRKQSGDKFSSELIDQFISAIGEFPTGTWVEFADGRTGVVCLQAPADQGGAQVVPIADGEQQPFLEVRWLSLHEHSEARALPPAERPHHAAAMERSLQAAIYAHGARKRELAPVVPV